MTEKPRLGGAAAGWEFQSSAADVGVRLAVWDHPGAGTDAWYVNRVVGFLGPGRHQLLVEDPRCQRAHAPEGLREVDLDLLDFVYLDRPAIPIETNDDATSGGGLPPDGGSGGVVTRVAAVGGTTAADAAGGTVAADAASGTAAADTASGTAAADAPDGTVAVDAIAGESAGRVRPEVLAAVGSAIANAKALVAVEEAAAQQLEEATAEESEEVAVEEAPPPHVVYGLGRGPPPEPDAPPGLGVNALGAFES